MNKLDLAVIFSIGAALALSPAHVAAQAAEKPISMGIKTEHITDGGLDGAGITSLLPGHTGAALGFKVGDIIIKVDGKPISPDVLAEYRKQKKVGDQLNFTVIRAGAEVEISGTAMAAPEGAPAPTPQPEG